MSSRILPFAFGLAPVALILLTWSGHETNWWVKVYALPILAVELATIVVAVLNGMRIRGSFATICLAGLMAIAWITAFFAPDPTQSLIMTEIWTLHLLFGFAAAFLFRASDLNAGILAGFVASAAALAVFATNAPPDLDWVGELPGLGNPRVFALYSAVAIGLCLGFLTHGKMWASAISTLAFVLVFWSGSRGAIVASLGALLICFALFPRVRKPSAWAPFVASAIAGAFFARMLGSPTKLVGITRLADTTDNGRFTLWAKTIDLIAERPWFGYGEAQTDYLLPIPWTAHPHNFILQVLLAWGVVGFALVVYLSCWAARRIFLNVDDETLPPIIVIIVLAIYSMFDGAIYNVQTAAIFAACVGIAVRNASRRKTQIGSNAKSD